MAEDAAPGGLPLTASLFAIHPIRNSVLLCSKCPYEISYAITILCVKEWNSIIFLVFKRSLK